jgi:hypothetical protein
MMVNMQDPGLCCQTHTALASRRREVLLKSVNVGVLAALFNFGAVARPDGLGIQVRDDIH